MTICASCEARNSDHSAFCLRCGAELRDAGARRDPGSSTDALPVVTDTTPTALVNRAANQLAEGHVAEALADCRRAIALEPANLEAHAILGMAYEQQGDLSAALEAYEAVLALDPERAVERQKAALLRLRLDGAEDVPGPHPEGFPALRVMWARVTANPPVAVGIAAGVLVFLVGSICIVHAARRAGVRDELAQVVAAGDQAYNQGSYVEAARQYAYAYGLNPRDQQLRQRWEQAYQAGLQAGTGGQIAQLPKYIPSSGPNPFGPVSIGGSQPAVPPPTDTAAAAVAGAPLPAYTQFSGRSDSLTPSPVSPPATPNNVSPAPPNGRRPPSPILPVDKGTVKNPPPTPPLGDTTPKPAKGEITIWVSEAPPPKAAGGNSAAKPSVGAEALRSQGEQLANQGRTDEAIDTLSRSASGFDEAARSDPAGAAIYRQSAESVRRRIDVLRMSR